MPTVRAYSINFPVDTRTGPESANASDRFLTLDEPHFSVGVRGEESFRIGEIIIDEAAGKFTLKSPAINRMTGEPLLVVGSLVNVSYQPLSEMQARKYYPHEFREAPTAAATPEARKMPAVRA